jgi:RNA polymerase-binding transcription factor DksA
MRDSFYAVSMGQDQWDEIFGKRIRDKDGKVVSIQKKSPPMYCSKCGREIREEIFYWSPGIVVCTDCNAKGETAEKIIPGCE